jgi:hypothetical protein
MQWPTSDGRMSTEAEAVSALLAGQRGGKMTFWIGDHHGRAVTDPGTHQFSLGHEQESPEADVVQHGSSGTDGNPAVSVLAAATNGSHDDEKNITAVVVYVRSRILCYVNIVRTLHRRGRRARNTGRAPRRRRANE